MEQPLLAPYLPFPSAIVDLPSRVQRSRPKRSTIMSQSAESLIRDPTADSTQSSAYTRPSTQNIHSIVPTSAEESYVNEPDSESPHSPNQARAILKQLERAIYRNASFKSRTNKFALLDVSCDKTRKYSIELNRFWSANSGRPIHAPALHNRIEWPELGSLQMATRQSRLVFQDAPRRCLFFGSQAISRHSGGR